MSTQKCVFFEVVCEQSAQLATANADWQDESTADFFRFSSRFGAISLRKRDAYPATFVHVEGPRLICGYGSKAARHARDESLVVILDASLQSVQIYRDQLATMPLFIGTQGGRLALSNQFERVCELLNSEQLHIDKPTLGLFLVGAITQPATLFEEIKIITERMRVSWSHDGLSQTLPADSHLPNKLDTRPGDARHAAHQLEQTLDSYWDRYGTTGIVAAELSGGADSSLVVGYLASRDHPVAPGSIIYSGSDGGALLARLDEFDSHFGVKSLRILSDPQTDYPLAAMDRTNHWTPFFYDHELYETSFEQLARHWAKQNITTVFTGIGGDDICQNVDQLSAIEQNEFLDEFIGQVGLPPFVTDNLAAYISSAATQRTAIRTIAIPPMPYSVHRAHITRNNIYLSYGLWPVSPLADPELYTYMQSLPARYRYRKNILRAYLHSRGFPAVITSPQTNEDFSNHFKICALPAMARYAKQFLHHSYLSEQGLINERLLQAAFAQAQVDNTVEAGDMFIKIYNTISAEILFRTCRLSPSFTI